MMFQNQSMYGPGVAMPRLGEDMQGDGSPEAEQLRRRLMAMRSQQPVSGAPVSSGYEAIGRVGGGLMNAISRMGQQVPNSTPKPQTDAAPSAPMDIRPPQQQQPFGGNFLQMLSGFGAQVPGSYGSFGGFSGTGGLY